MVIVVLMSYDRDPGIGQSIINLEFSAISKEKKRVIDPPTVGQTLS